MAYSKDLVIILVIMLSNKLKSIIRIDGYLMLRESRFIQYRGVFALSLHSIFDVYLKF